METKLRIIDALDNNKKGIHIRALARLIQTSYNNTVRNISILEKENTIKKEKYANLIKIRLKSHPRTIAYLKQVHTEKFLQLPKKTINAINTFLEEIQEKPLLVIIFGSYAKNNYTEQSDIDLLLVYQKINSRKEIENTAKRISMKTNTKLSPVYVNYKQFENNFLNKNHDFSNEIRQQVILLIGIEYYYNLLWRFLA